MSLFLRHLEPRSRSKRTSRDSTVRLQVENLEGRRVPATVGVMKSAALDFDGADISRRDILQGGWDIGDQSFDSFHSLFDNSRPWLDMNRDGNVNATDANLAKYHIMAKVKADFAPYNLSIFEMNQEQSQGFLTDSTIGDVTVIITGTDIRSPFPNLNASDMGVAPTLDVGNTGDEIVFVFARQRLGYGEVPRDEWLNQVAMTISHEMAHAFGLGHEVSNLSGVADDALSHSIMAVPSGKDTVRDFERDFVFLDRYFRTETGGYQNAHRELLKDNVLGRRNSTYVSVLQPGVLTVSGNSFANTIGVSQIGSTYWKIVADGRTTYVPRNSYNVHSLNPFATPLSRIDILGEGGNDYLYVDSWFPFQAVIHGGDGDDVIAGGAAGDVLYGHAGDDYLDGGADGFADYLLGGTGADRFKQESAYAYWYGYLFWYNRDAPYDFDYDEGDAFV